MNKSIIDRIKSNFIIGGVDHWLWTGALVNGRAVIKYKGKTHTVARLVLELFKGEVFGPNEQANHKPPCEIKHCINPAHLYKGTQADNMRDCKTLHPGKTKFQRNQEYYRKHNQHRENWGRE